MCQPQEKCLACQQAQEKSEKWVGIFSCSICQVDFQEGKKLYYRLK